MGDTDASPKRWVFSYISYDMCHRQGEGYDHYTSDKDFSGVLYLEWTEIPDETVPMIIGFSIGAVLLAGAFVALHIRGKN